MTTSNLARTALVAAALLPLGVTGCATKKYLHAVVDPLRGRVGDIEEKQKENANSIEELEGSVSRADERAQTADKKAVAADERAAAAAKEAAAAADKAGEAGRAAVDARTFAAKGLTDLDQRVSNVHNFQFVSAETVLFPFGASRLDDEARQQLDSAAAKINLRKPFVVEVQGFTDATGSRKYNLDLSRDRAAAVVRYLTVEHKIPLHRIHVLGLGSETPVADNTTREGRKQNRRVEVKLYEADLQTEAKLSSR